MGGVGALRVQDITRQDIHMLVDRKAERPLIMPTGFLRGFRGDSASRILGGSHGGPWHASPNSAAFATGARGTA
jgi:hypothetical protein